MKVKTILFALLAIFFVSSCSDDDKHTDSPAVLPSVANSLISTYFPGTTVRSVEIDSRLRDYEVKLSDGTSLEFDRDGALIEVDCSHSSGRVPDGLILPAILEYVNQNYPGRDIESYEIRSDGYEVDLHNGLDLFFDRDGKFVRFRD